MAGPGSLTSLVSSWSTQEGDPGLWARTGQPGSQHCHQLSSGGQQILRSKWRRVRGSSGVVVLLAWLLPGLPPLLGVHADVLSCSSPCLQTASLCCWRPRPGSCTQPHVRACQESRPAPHSFSPNPAPNHTPALASSLVFIL